MKTPRGGPPPPTRFLEYRGPTVGGHRIESSLEACKELQPRHSELEFESSSCFFPQNLEAFRNRAWTPPKSCNHVSISWSSKSVSFFPKNLDKILPKTSQSEPRGLQNRAREPYTTQFFKTSFLRRLKWATHLVFRPKMADSAPTWRPKALPNRRQNAKKSMSKKASFFDSIFSSSGSRFGRLFGGFLEERVELILNFNSKLESLKTLVFLGKTHIFKKPASQTNV